MPVITNTEASANILAACEAHTLVQKHWHTRADDGRELACLLGSIGPGVNSASDCNAELMPLWLAEITVSLFDGISENAIYPMAQRFGVLVGRWHVLTPEHWDRVLHRFLVRL